ncbi:MAG: lysylphosphatidylglycerol synthase transmembrane domain-containing protein [Myxococcota bacterium]|nr:lysylphosphatidylglycerol synthase transmembrane domain-containing protein [Myxococcota bacterium]
MKSLNLHALVAIALSLAAVLWFAWDIDWGDLGTVLSEVKLGWVLLASVLLLGEFGIRALRWKVLLRPLGRETRLTDLFASTVIGAAVNTLFPLRAGEVAKPVVAARRTGHSLSEVVATAVMERVYDILGLVSVLVLMVLVLPPGASAEGELVTNLKLYGGAFGFFALTCMFVFFHLATRPDPARRLFELVLTLAPRRLQEPFLGLFDGFVRGLGNARDRKGLWQAGGLTLWMWLDGALAIYLLFFAFDIDLPFGAACFVAVAIALTVALPQAPGFIGVFHVAIEKTLVLWGLEGSPAKGFAIVFWAVSFVPVTLTGIVGLWGEGMSLGAMRRLPERADDPASGDEPQSGVADSGEPVPEVSART